MEKQEMIFADGMGFKARHEKAPETVRGSVYFNVEKFKAFLDKNKDERGWVNTKMMKSKEKGTIYFILDTYKPKTAVDDETGEIIPPSVGYKSLDEVTSPDPITGGTVDLSSIPF